MCVQFFGRPQQKIFLMPYQPPTQDTCNNYYVLQASEVPAPFSMSVSEALIIGSLIGTVWCAAWVWRRLYRMLDADEAEPLEEGEL